MEKFKYTEVELNIENLKKLIRLGAIILIFGFLITIGYGINLNHFLYI